MIFETLFEYSTLYEAWEELPQFQYKLTTRLGDLEFFVTALISPIIIDQMVDNRITFGIFNRDNISNKDGEFTDTWYQKHGEGLVI